MNINHKINDSIPLSPLVVHLTGDARQGAKLKQVLMILFENTSCSLRLHEPIELAIKDLYNLTKTNRFIANKYGILWKLILKNVLTDYPLSDKLNTFSPLVSQKLCLQLNRFNFSLDINNIIQAATNNYPELVDLLLAMGANPDTIGANARPLIMDAAKKGHLHVVDSLLKANANIECPGFPQDSVLYCALDSGNFSVLHKLIEAHVNRQVVEACVDTATPKQKQGAFLRLAAMKGEKETVKALLKEGVDLTWDDSYYHHPLWLAAMNGRTDVLNVLLKLEATDSDSDSDSDYEEQRIIINRADKFGLTPIMAAIMMRQYDAIDTLINARANVHLRNKAFFTPLMMAVQAQDKKAVKTLIAAGADPDARFDRDTTTFSLAIQGNDNEIIKMICDACNSSLIEGASSFSLR